MTEQNQRTKHSVKAFFRKKEKTENGQAAEAAPFLKTACLLWGKFKLFLTTDAESAANAKNEIVSFVVKWWHWVLGGVFAFMVLYYPAGALLYNRIDLNPRLGETAAESRTRALDTMAELIARETEKNVYTPNLPFFFPTSVLDNMPSFQTGVMQGVYVVTAAFSRAQGAPEPLERAAAAAGYPADVWHIDGWKPAVSSVKKYRAAENLISAYTADVAKETAPFDASCAALKTVLSGMVRDMRDGVAMLDVRIAKGDKKMFDTVADNDFYTVKGRMYVYFLTLRDLKNDFKAVFSNKAVASEWETAMAALKKALAIQPMFVVNGSAETQFAPNHLMGLGFYLQRAQTALSDMVQLIQPVENE